MNVENWMKQIRQKVDPGTEIVLVGNKLDLVEEREFSEGQRMADQFGIHFFAVSTKSKEGVNEAFQTLTDMIISRDPKIRSGAAQNANRLTKDPNIPDKIKCCG